MGDGFAVLGERSVAEHTDGVQRQIRASPQDASLRLALCHFLALRGDWQRADDQLKTVTKLDPSFAPAAATCAMALRGERHRSEFWAGGAKAPAVIGESAEWIDQLIAAAALPAESAEEAAALREAARQAAPALQGKLTVVDRSDARPEQTVEGEPAETIDFDWLCDGDVRLGPVLEVFTHSGYSWLPLSALRSIQFKRPEHLVDLLWSPAEIELADGQSVNALVPVRYPGSIAASDDELVLGRRTDWLPLAGEEQYAGLGQRTLISEAGDHSLLDLRRVEITAAAAQDAAP